jgi:hypothetical protein
MGASPPPNACSHVIHGFAEDGGVMTITVAIPNLGMKKFLRCDSGTEGLAGQLLRKRRCLYGSGF